MKILFLHGWNSVPGGIKPTYLAEHGHTVINPKLSDDDFAEAVRVAQAEFDKHQPQVVVGSSRGGAVALNIDSGAARLVLLCPAWRNWGTATAAKAGTVILHARRDDVIAFADSESLLQNSRLPRSALIEVGSDHRLADPGPLEAMLKACEAKSDLVDVTVYYLEMLAPPRRILPAPRDGLTVRHVPAPTVAYYRSLYTAVGQEYYWLSRRKMSDEALGRLIGDPSNELHVLHVGGEPAGFAELDCRVPADVELTQFGLMPGYIGQGLGKWFLQWTIDCVWGRAPKRFWLHTCTLDHRAALPNYVQAGFVLFKEEAIQREL
jgi:GNAT superfamily N-acetyltransferase